MSARRLAPAEFAFAMTYREVRQERARQGPWQSNRAKRAIRDADLHKLFRVGRELLEWNMDGSPRLDADGCQRVRRISKSESLNAIALVGLVKKIAALDPCFEISDAQLAERARRDMGEGWSLSTVRRTRKLCWLAGLEVRPLALSELPGLRQRGLTGSVWVLDRRRLALVENVAPPESGLTRGVVNSDHTPLLYARAKSGLPSVDRGQKPPPRAGPDVERASAAVKAALRELRSEERRRQRAQPTSAEPLHQPTLRLVAALFVERWKVRMDWGDAAALAQAAERALALQADSDRVAAARSYLAAQLLGEQLRIRGLVDGADNSSTNASESDAAAEGGGRNGC